MLPSGVDEWDMLAVVAAQSDTERGDIRGGSNGAAVLGDAAIFEDGCDVCVFVGLSELLDSWWWFSSSSELIPLLSPAWWNCLCRRRRHKGKSAEGEGFEVWAEGKS
jgi:hypothetical protein